VSPVLPDPLALQRQRRRLLRSPQTPWLQALMAERLAERLDWFKLDAQQVVLWQGLAGGGAQALRQRFPQAQQCWVEEAPWLDAARRQAGPWWQPWRAKRTSWQTPQQLRPGQAQLLWANLGLLGETAPEALFKAWQSALAPQGYLLFSTLGPDSFKELRALYAAQGWGPAGPDWIDLHDLGDALLRSGFADPVMDQERITLTWADGATLWRDLAALGGNLAQGRFAGLRSPRWQAAWVAAAEAALRGRDGRLSLTLEFVCGHAIRPEPRLPGESTVSLDSLREQLAQRRKP
jgi:malonyl-CoA O-methyltransferase